MNLLQSFFCVCERKIIVLPVRSGAIWGLHIQNCTGLTMQRMPAEKINLVWHVRCFNDGKTTFAFEHNPAVLVAQPEPQLNLLPPPLQHTWFSSLSCSTCCKYPIF